MTAVPIDTFRPARPYHPVGAHRAACPRRARRPPARAVFRRRRFLAALAGLGLVLTVARAAAALEGSSPVPLARPPHVRAVVVQPGDSLWSVAHRLAPHSDPRNVVDAIVEARGTTVVTPGETITWLDE